MINTKKILTAGGLILTCWLSAQITASDDGEHHHLLDRVNDLEKQAGKFNLYLNYQGSFDVFTDQEKDWNAGFKSRQFRLEAKGDLTDKLFYRFRHRLNKGTAAQSLDNLAKATDMMYVGYHINDKSTVIAGKQCQSWGGFEFDLNPIDIYEYSDMIDNMDNFMMGATYQYSPVKNHEFVLQVTDASNNKFSDEYGDLSAQGIKESKIPLTYIFNWNGSMFNNKWQTRWSYGLQTLAENKYSRMLVIGNKLNLSHFQVALDYMRDNEQLDRLKIASSDGREYLNSHGLGFFENVDYNSFIMKAEYQPAEKWNIFVKGMYETASVKNSPEYKNYRKAYGYFAGTEFRPFSDQDLKIFLAYVGRSYDYSEKVNTLKDYSTNRISLGIIYRIKAY